VQDQREAWAEPATFDPVAAATFGDQSVYGHVVTDGRGTFHSIARVDGAEQKIVYRASNDGGLSWQVRAMFAGEAGGASRPSIAVDGDRVAIVFLGLWCEPIPQPPCHEVPYLVISTDAGKHWDRPVRLDRSASEVTVAVDDDRIWVAWDRFGLLRLVGTDERHNDFARWDFDGHDLSLAAADGAMVLAYEVYDTARGRVAPMALTADGRTVNGSVELARGQRMELPSWKSSAAAADGNVYVLLADRPENAVEDPPWVSVAAASSDGAFGPPVRLMEKGVAASISAGHGTVAVATADADGLSWISTSSDDGVSFSAPVAVSSTPGAVSVAVAVAVQGPDRPLPRFAWSVAPHLTDFNGDQLRDPANWSDNVSDGQTRIAANRFLDVSFDGCDSRAGAGRTITKYTWYFDGEEQPPGPEPCKTELPSVVSGETVEVRLVVEDDHADAASSVQLVRPRDLVVVSIGDSVASGEGSPHTGGLGSVTWQDAPCDRSAHAGPARAAGDLESEDDHSSVTFVQLACSGAAIVDVPEVTGVDDPKTGGLLDHYQGVAPQAGSLRPSQLEQMATLLQGRTVDALTVSIGANDVKFSDVVVGCLLSFSCNEDVERSNFEFLMQDLPDRYDRLAGAIQAFGIRANRVHLTEYFDPTSDDLGVTNMRCAANESPFGAAPIDDDEAIWARDGVIAPLNQAGRNAAHAAGWRYVGGIAAQFRGHGYCADDHWIVRLGESVSEQHNEFGAFHPNRTGQLVYRRALFSDLRASLLLPQPLGPDDVLTEPPVLGEVMVVTSSMQEVVAASVLMTGHEPQAAGSRRLDRGFGDGATFIWDNPVALDSNAAVTTWIEMDRLEFETLIAQVGARPNAAVRSVRVVQAPDDARRMVAGRDTLVQATIDTTVGARTPLDVTTTVTAEDGDGNVRTLVPAITTTIEFDPGRTTLLLPQDAAFTAQPDERVEAIVEVQDPPGALASDAFDNKESTPGDARPIASTTRPLRVLFGRAAVGDDTVPCLAVQSLAQRMTSYVAQALPVDRDGVSVDLFCGLLTPVPRTSAGMHAALVEADEMARFATADMVVLVAPDGWLRAAFNGAVGAAAPGTRAAMVEETAPDMALAHEIAHTFGIRHTDDLVPAHGARIDRRKERGGVDWMAPTVQEKEWTGGGTWDQLVERIGGPENAPQPVDPTGPSIWIRGSVEQQPDGSWHTRFGHWFSTNPGDPFDPVVDGSLETARMTVQLLDASGSDLGPPQPVGLGPTGGKYAQDATPSQVPTGYTFATRIALAPGARSLELALDGAAVDTVPLSMPPTVTLTSPAAGSRVPRGEPLTVSWSANDPDGDPLTADVYVSDDGGASWRPFVAGATGTSVTVDVPQDVGGDEVRVRLVVTDGARFAEAVSGPFSAEPATALGRERVAFVRDADFASTTAPRILTMNPDGGDLVDIGLPAVSTRPGSQCASEPYYCTVVYREPASRRGGATGVCTSPRTSRPRRFRPAAARFTRTGRGTRCGRWSPTAAISDGSRPIPHSVRLTTTAARSARTAACWHG
jgi:hypothetical protein